MSEHTPGPWEILPGHSERRLIIRHDWRSGRYVAQIGELVGGPDLTPEDRANAAFIVRACNSHDALIAALEEADDNMDTLAANLRNGITEGAASLIPRFRAAIRAALAQAKGAS